MTQIKKLMLRGIRSFNPSTSNTIEFHSPLTLILGPNGTGKTTIIESLKYATTGTFPPNTKNGAFLYDPRLIGEAETRSQVKLKFENTKSQTMVCTRSLQLSHKRSKAEQRTLESVLWTVNEDGEQVSVSGKCANIDREMPFYLGVSSAVLENVILCHQEESTWILEEPKIVKKKMDDLFESTKVIKAIDVLKNVKKEFLAELKHRKQAYEFLKDGKNKKETLAVRICAQKNELKSLEQRIGSLGDELFKFEEVQNEIKTQIKKLELLETENLKIQIEIENLRKSTGKFCGAKFSDLEISEMRAWVDETAENELVALKSDFEEMQKKCEKEEEKAQKAKNAHEKMRNLDAQLREDAREKNEITGKIENEKKKLFGICEEAFKEDQQIENELKKQIEIFEVFKDLKNLKKFDDFLCCNKINDEQDFDSNVSLNVVNENFDNNEKLKNEKSEKINTLKKLNEKNLSTFKTLLNFLETEKKSVEMLLNQNTFKIKHFKGLLIKSDEIEKPEKIPEVTIEEIEKCIFEVENEIEKKQSLFDEEFLKYEINLKKEMEWKKYCGLEAELRKKCDEAEKNTNIDNLKVINLKMKHQIKEKKLQVEEKSVNLKNKQKKFQGDQKTQSELRFTLGHHQESLKKAFSDLCQHSCNSYEIEEKIELPVNERDELRHNLSSSSNAQLIYRNLQKLGISKGECPICKKRFFGNEKSEFMAKMENVIEKIPVKIRETEFELVEIERKMEDLKKENWRREEKNKAVENVRVVIKEILKLLLKCKEIGIFSFDKNCFDGIDDEDVNDDLSIDELFFEDSDDKNINDNKSVKEENLFDINLLNENKSHFFDQKSNFLLKKLILTDNQIEKLLNLKLKETEIDFEEEELEIIDLEEEIYRLEEITKIIEEMMSLDVDGHDFANFDFESLKNEIKTKKEQLLNLKKNKNEVLKFGDYLKRKNEIEKNRQENEKYEIKIRELFSTNEKLKVKSDELESKIVYFKKTVDDLKKRHAEIWKLIYECSVRIEQDGLKIEKLADRIQKAKFEIENLEIGEFDEQEIEKMKAEIKNRMKIYYEKNELRNKMLVKREQIGNYVKFRDEKGRLAKLEASHEQESIKNLKVLRQKYELLSEKRGKIENLKSVSTGERHRLIESIELLEKEIDKEIDEKECRGFVAMKVVEQLIFDMENCLKALDKTIVEYHSKKLVEINQNLKELWSSTYKGNDIDYIELKADIVESKSYNYKMVMVKNGCELDMRSRSSAGQKMIASIIVRLALSDAFTTNLSLLALDEPTTNLDQENIESLANTLIGIIEKKRDDANFQLIVITHDECLVQMLSSCCEVIYKLKRNGNGDSMIERKAI